MVGLTAEQLQALDASPGTPPVLVDQRTEETDVLTKSVNVGAAANELKLSEGIQLAWTGFKRDLPGLLAKRQNLGRWVCYRRDQQIALGKDYAKLVEDCVRQGIPESEYMVFPIEAGAARDDDEFDRTFVEYDDE